MSLILEALKRSEKERQQRAHSVTDTLYIQTARPQRRLWPWLLVGLLLINLSVLLFVWWQDSRSVLPPTPAAAVILDNARSREHIKIPPAPVLAPSTTRKDIARPAAPVLILPLGEAPSIDAHPKAHAASKPARPLVTITTSQPREAAASSSSSVKATHTTPPPPANAPEADADQLVQLQNYEINTIVYSDNPSKRYALVNMKKLREGHTLPGSHFKIKAITPQGLIIDLGNGLVRYSGQP